MKYWDQLNESWQKVVKLGIVSFVVLFCYIFLFAVDADDNAFLITGGAIGFVSSSIVVWNCIARWEKDNGWPPQISLLFWRALCETGIGTRYLLQPAFNLYVCQSLTCTRETGDPSRCGFPSFMLEFFVLASEFWFLCNGLDLYYSITNPFFSYNKRVMYYHIFCWSMAAFFAASPFFLVPEWTQIYGFWFINPNIDDSANCWIKITWNNYAWPIWVYFFVPLLFIYMVCLFSLVTAYLRLRRGVTRSFLPRMRLLIMNTVNLVVHMLYWTVFVLFYSWTFWAKQDFKSGGNQPTNNIIYFVMGSKGCSALLVWILTANNSQLGLKQKKASAGTNKDGNDGSGAEESNVMETIDANKALREEVLSFATAGIRSSARNGSKLTPDRKTVTRRPQQHDSSGSDDFKDLINPRFFLRFILGYTDELTALEELVSNKQRGVNESFMRQTVTVTPASQSAYLRHRGSAASISSGNIHALNARHNNNTSNTASAGEGGCAGVGSSEGDERDSRMSQRPTVVSGSDQHQVYGRASAAPSFFSRFSSSFLFTNNPSTTNTAGGKSALDRRLSALDRNLREQDNDPESGLEMENTFTHTQSETSSTNGAGPGGRPSMGQWRSSNMIEMDKNDGEKQGGGASGLELFDLSSTQRYFWNSVYNFFLDPSESVEFTEYEPFHFRRVRLSVGITDAIYSMYFATTIKERLTQGGASGAFFFFSKGEKCIAKSCTSEELDTLKNNALAYADYMEVNTNSVISRIYGAYRLQIYGNSLYFFVMNNIFLNAEGLAMNEKYDIKGSWVARNATPPHKNMTVTCTYCEQKYVYSTARSKKKSGKRNTKRELKHTVSMDGSLRSDPPTPHSQHSPSNTSSKSTTNVTSTTSTKNHVVANLANIGLFDNATEVQSPLQALGPKSPSNSSFTGGGPPISQLASMLPLPWNQPGSHMSMGKSGEDPEDNQHERGGCPYTVSGEHEPNVILKDNDIKYKIRLPRATTEQVLAQLRSDVDFLFSIGVMDYSLLVGVHNTEYEVMAEDPGSTTHTLVKASNSSASSYNLMSNGIGNSSGSNTNSPNNTLSKRFAAGAKTYSTDSHDTALNTAANTNANRGTSYHAAARTGTSGGDGGDDRVYSGETDGSGGTDLGFARKLEVYRVVGPDAYFMGIIDFQQKWTIAKRLERFVKVNIYGCDPDGTSAIEPAAYRDRFLKKMEDILDSDSANANKFLPSDPLLGR